MYKIFRNGNRAIYLRNFIFGVEDSLVSTVGLLSGVAIAGTSRNTIILTGAVLIFVEAFSMAVGSLLSEHSSEEYVRQAETPLKASLVGGAIMFVSYFISGFIPISPYIFLDSGVAFWVSISLSLFALFVLGTIGGKLSHVNILRSGFKMFLIGGAAVGLGVLVAKIINGSL